MINLRRIITETEPDARFDLNLDDFQNLAERLAARLSESFAVKTAQLRSGQLAFVLESDSITLRLIKDNGDLRLESLDILVRRRRQGIGRKVVKELLTFSQEKKIRSVILTTLADDVIFWRKMGFDRCEGPEGSAKLEDKYFIVQKDQVQNVLRQVLESLPADVFQGEKDSIILANKIIYVLNKATEIQGKQYFVMDLDDEKGRRAMFNYLKDAAAN